MLFLRGQKSSRRSARGALAYTRLQCGCGACQLGIVSKYVQTVSCKAMELWVRWLIVDSEGFGDSDEHINTWITLAAPACVHFDPEQFMSIGVQVGGVQVE